MLCWDEEIERAAQTKNVIVHVVLRYDKYSVVCLDGRRKYAHTHARRHASAHARTRSGTQARMHATVHARTQPRTHARNRARASMEDLECLKDLGLKFNFERRMSRLRVS